MLEGKSHTWWATSMCPLVPRSCGGQRMTIIGIRLLIQAPLETIRVEAVLEDLVLP